MPLGSRHLVDPELEQMLELMPTVTWSDELLPLLRIRPAWAPTNPDDLERTELIERRVPGPLGAPDVNIRIYRPRTIVGPLPCIFHIHGGGYVTGKAAEMEGAHLSLAADLGCCIVSIDYRLAPETRHPGPIEDCYAALGWLVDYADKIGVDRSLIGVMGESAGGGLAAALALLVRDRSEHRLAFQHLIYPMLDDRTCTLADPHPYTGEFIVNAASNHFGWSSLLGHEPGRDGVSPYAAPARAENLAGLPPAFIATGALDLFLEEDVEYARRLLRAGVPVELHVYPGAFHAFNAWPKSQVAANLRRDSREALARALATSRAR